MGGYYDNIIFKKCVFSINFDINYAVFFYCIASAEPLENLTSKDVSGDNRYVTIILHAGEQGYSGNDPSVKEKESIQYNGDAFYDRIVPNTDNPNLLFVGWSLNPEAEEPDYRLYVDEDIVEDGYIDVYAVYQEYKLFTLDPNGGFFESTNRALMAITLPLEGTVTEGEFIITL